MKKLIRIVRLSSKEWFKNLRKKWSIYCNSIDRHFIVSNLFLNHISWSSKKRELRDIIERLSTINLIEKIADKWILIEERSDIIVENKRFLEELIKYYVKFQK